jgi:hypothetical protein
VGEVPLSRGWPSDQTDKSQVIAKGEDLTRCQIYDIPPGGRHCSVSARLTTKRLAFEPDQRAPAWHEATICLGSQQERGNK